MIHTRTIFFFVFFALIILAVLGTSDIDSFHQVMLTSKFGYEYVFSLLFLLLVFTLLYYSVKRFSLPATFDLFRPSIIISGLFIASTMGGSVSYIITWLIWPHFVLDIAGSVRVVAYSLMLIGMGITITYILIRPYVASNKTIHIPSVINPHRLRIAIIITFVMGAVGSYLVFSKLGFIPILKNLSISERANLGAMIGPGLSSKLYLMLMITIMLSLVYMMKVSFKDLFGLMFYGLSFLLLFGFGARFFFVMPTLVGLFCFNKYTKRIKLVHLLLGFVAIFPLLIGYISLREDYFTAEGTGIYGFGWYLFGEFRDFTYMLEKLGHYNQYLNGTTLMNVVYTALPQQIWEVFGINKLGEMYSSATFSADFLYKANSGIRIGILGEFFINFGMVGIYIGAFIFGLCIGVLDIFYEAIPARSTGQIFISFLTVNLVFAVIGQIDGVFSTIYYYGYVLTAIILFIRQKENVTNA